MHPTETSEPIAFYGGPSEQSLSSEPCGHSAVHTQFAACQVPTNNRKERNVVIKVKEISQDSNSSTYSLRYHNRCARFLSNATVIKLSNLYKLNARTIVMYGTKIVNEKL